MRFLMVILLAFSSSLPAQAVPQADLCLKRIDPIGKKEVRTYFWSKAPADWTADPLIIHDADNRVCGPTDACFIKPLEIMFLSSTSAQSKLIRYGNGPSSPEVITLKPESSGKYLLGSGSNYDIFVMYSGVRACNVALGENNDAYEGPNGATKPCHFFTVETYPKNLSAWKEYRPDHSGVWVSVSECAGVPYQPGGGGGHDPP